MEKKITENTTLVEILEKPELVKILAKYNLPCLGCSLAKFEIEKLKIGGVCKMYEIDVQKLLGELNKPRSENLTAPGK